MSRHHPARIYRGLLRRLSAVLALADDEAWLTQCRIVDAPRYFDDARMLARNQQRKAMGEVARMLHGLQRAGAVTRAGAYLLTALFACAAFAGANPQSPHGQTFIRLLRWVWRVERLCMRLRRSE